MATHTIDNPTSLQLEYNFDYAASPTTNPHEPETGVSDRPAAIAISGDTERANSDIHVQRRGGVVSSDLQAPVACMDGDFRSSHDTTIDQAWIAGGQVRDPVPTTALGQDTSPNDPSSFTMADDDMNVSNEQGTYVQHRALMDGLQATLARMQDLEENASKRLNRIRHMKNRTTKQIQAALLKHSQDIGSDILCLSSLSTDQHSRGFASGTSPATTMKSETVSTLADDGDDTIVCRPRTKKRPCAGTLTQRVPQDRSSLQAYEEPFESDTDARYQPGLFVDRDPGMTPARSSDAQPHKDIAISTGPYRRSRRDDYAQHQGRRARYPHAQSQPVLAAKCPRQRQVFRALPRGASPQVDDATATKIIVEAKLKGNARHRAAPGYFRTQGYLYVDHLWILDQKDELGNLIISREKAVGSFDTGRYIYPEV